jgi:3',5'-cyclic AMP phosphodiesterase CpdA
MLATLLHRATPGLAAGMALLLAACTTPAPPPLAPPVQAWVQAAADGQWQVRAITSAAQCPKLRWADGQLPMRTRAAPAVLPARTLGAQPDSKASVFDLRSCEATWPASVARLQVVPAGERAAAQLLLQPRPEPQHIVLIGDTGCRMKQSENAFQDCLDPQQWPFAAIAQAAAAQQPDLVVHVGDIHYRESPCPPGRAGCAGSPWGYGADVWQADLFQPAAPLLAAAPWVFVRGNHESCSRAGLGWFRFVDAAPWAAPRTCEDPAQDSQGDFSEPYAVALSADTQLIVFDSSFAAGRAYAPESPVFQRYAAQLRRVAALAATKPHNFFLNHHPVLGFAGSADGAVKPGNAALLSVMAAAHPERLYADGVNVVMNGHVHLFEALGFASAHPATLVLGNSGSQMEGRVASQAALAAQPAPGAQVQSFATQAGFGFATLDRAGDLWRLSEWDVSGQRLLSCTIRGSRLSC